MKIWKLVSGILSMIIFIVVVVQSCAAGLGNALSDNGEVSGSGGIVLAVLMLAGGIISVCTRGSEGKGGNIVLIILFAIAALIGFVTAGSYADLYIWAAWCTINAILAAVALFTGGSKKSGSKE